MNGLYNALHGMEGIAQAIVASLGVAPARFRDAWPERQEDGSIVLVIHTRTGGGNRDCFAEDGDCSKCYHTANSEMAKSPFYISDEDSDFDPTYADFRFRCPPEFEPAAHGYLDAVGRVATPAEKWEATLEALRGQSP